MHPERIRIAGWMAFLALAVGCSDEASGPADSVSEVQATTIATEVVNAWIGAYNSGGSSGSTPALFAEPVGVNVQYSHTESCPLFGRIGITGSLTGSIDSQTGDGVLWLQVTETLTDCTFTDGEQDLIVNGGPSLTLTGNFSFLGGQPATQQSLTLSGGLNWQFDPGGSGFCAVNLSINLATQASGTTTVSGTVCGRQVNLSS